MPSSSTTARRGDPSLNVELDASDV